MDIFLQRWASGNYNGRAVIGNQTQQLVDGVAFQYILGISDDITGVKIPKKRYCILVCLHL